MRATIEHGPVGTALRVVLERPGEQIVAAASSVAVRDGAIEARTARGDGERTGGGRAGATTTCTATAPGQSLWLAPPCDGAIEVVPLLPGAELFLDARAWLASTPGIALDATWRGARHFFEGRGFEGRGFEGRGFQERGSPARASEGRGDGERGHEGGHEAGRGRRGGGATLLRAWGEGQVWFAAYGGFHVIDLGGAVPAMVCDTAHVVAFTQGLQPTFQAAPALAGPAGDARLVELRGAGRVWLQTRRPAALAAFLHPFRGVGGGSPSD